MKLIISQPGTDMTIILNSDWISDITRGTYTVSDSGTITESTYNRYLSIISNPLFGRLSKDNLLNPDGSLKDGCEYLAALLICDMIQAAPITDRGIVSENFGGDYSYQKSSSVVSDIKSAFMEKYENSLSSRNKGTYSSQSSVADRSDVNIEFAKLTQGNIPSVSTKRIRL